MLALTATTGRFGTNVHVVAPGPGQPCLIVDPGHEAADAVEQAVRDHRLEPEAVLITHGHMDHTWDAVPLARRYGIPAWIHPDDRYQFGAPAKGLPDTFPRELLAGHPDREPHDVRELPAQGGELTFASGTVTVLHTPGHTGGSSMFRFDDDRPLLATGDTLLATGRGRADAPGASPSSLDASVRDVVRRCPGETVLLTGHGPATTLGEIDIR
ncbi:MBL fold metallo-hydrolase [Streptomyces sp. NPDC057245]|uniref:MBL fold metallo-hydrolase n=1 Tax=Streptomyces TaxID=1883 RepID=UPI001C1E1D17|nr:MBL fold metallo-hydrolase [Streptomyces sp. A108]MBU6529818.1 MBL fold metallo-hydrolase [Streptomyces sp. A108]